MCSFIWFQRRYFPKNTRGYKGVNRRCLMVLLGSGFLSARPTPTPCSRWYVASPRTRSRAEKVFKRKKGQLSVLFSCHHHYKEGTEHASRGRSSVQLPLHAFSLHRLKTLKPCRVLSEFAHRFCGLNGFALCPLLFLFSGSSPISSFTRSPQQKMTHVHTTLTLHYITEEV